jgi:hypothetical protein
MSKKIIITEEEKNNIKSLYNISEQGAGDLLKDLMNDFITGISVPKVDKPELNSTTTSDDDFYKSILTCIGAKPTKSNLLFMYAWRQAEGGKAKNNPFNTSHKMPGSTTYNSHGVQNYKNSEDGIQATCRTLKNGRYDKVVQGFKNDVGLSRLSDAVTSSPWGTKDLLTRITKDYIVGVTPKPKDIA